MRRNSVSERHKYIRTPSNEQADTSDKSPLSLHCRVGTVLLCIIISPPFLFHFASPRWTTGRDCNALAGTVSGNGLPRPRSQRVTSVRSVTGAIWPPHMMGDLSASTISGRVSSGNGEEPPPDELPSRTAHQLRRHRHPTVTGWG